ncbi:MAG: hypothetical protein KKB74_03715 [Bacteroidetes bacterium]|nr:hypothetical protein [Bacteroidota bacterium]
MNKLQQIIWLLLIPSMGLTQIESSPNFEYKTGKPFRFSYGSENYFFCDNDEILAVKIDNMEVTLQKFNSVTLSLQSDKKYKDFPVDWVPEHVTEYNNRYFIFYALWDRNANKEQLFYREIDFQKGTFKDNGILLIQIDGKITGTYSGIPGRAGVVMADKFDFHTSFDSSYMLIKYRKNPDSKSKTKNQDVLGTCVFDKELQMSWRQDVMMPYDEKKMNILDYAIDSKGNVFILSIVFTDNSSKMKLIKGNSNYHVELLRIRNNTQIVEKSPINFGSRLINSIALYEGSNDELVCAGYFNYGQNIENANGLFFFKQSSMGPVSEVKFFDFTKDIVNQNTGKKAARQDNRDGENAEIENLVLRNLKLATDGSIVLVGEQSYTKQGPEIFNEYSEDIVVSKLTSQGELGWIKKLPRRQWKAYSSESGLSFNYLFTEGHHYFLTLDNVKNLNLPIYEVPEKYHYGYGGILTCTEIDDLTGNAINYLIFDSKDIDGINYPDITTNNWIAVSEKELIFQVAKNNKQMVLIRLKVGD